jgi:uncharacterized membrane protein
VSVCDDSHIALLRSGAYHSYMTTTASPKKYYFIAAIGALAGIVANFWQTLDKLALLEQSDTALFCDVNDVLSCSSVLELPEASLLGFPNSLLAVVIFGALFAVAIAGLLGSKLSKSLLTGAIGVSYVMLLMGTWFILTSTFSVDALCMFCAISFSGLLLLAGSLSRARSAAVKDNRYRDNIVGLAVFAAIVVAVVALRLSGIWI